MRNVVISTFIVILKDYKSQSRLCFPYLYDCVYYGFNYTQSHCENLPFVIILFRMVGLGHAIAQITLVQKV